MMEITIGLAIVLALIGAIWLVMEIQKRGETFGLNMFSSIQFILLAVGTVFTFLYLVNAGKFIVIDKEGYSNSFSEIAGESEKLREFETQADWNKFSPAVERHRQGTQKIEDTVALDTIKKILSKADTLQQFENELKAAGFTIRTVGDRYNSIFGKICYLLFFSASLFLNVRQSTFGFGATYTVTQAILCAIAILVVILLILAVFSKDDKRRRRKRS